MTETKQFRPAGKVKTIKGTVIQPESAGLKLVLNIINTKGKAEHTLYPIFDKKWKRVKEDAKGFYNTRTGAYKLGALYTTAVQSDVWVIHCVVQGDDLKIDANGVNLAFKELLKMAKEEKASVHISSLLSDLDPVIQSAAQEQLVANGVNVSYYQEQ